MIAGAALLAGFVAWERVLTSRGQGVRPLVELPLFRSAGFSWGTILATLVSFAMFGIMFAMPQYFQEVRGADALGSGLQMLPMIGGMLAGMVAGTRLQSPRRPAACPAGQRPGTRPGARPGTRRPPLAGARSMVAAGFAVMAAGLAMGAFTTVSSGTGFAAAWFAVSGLGLGVAMPSAMNAALGALSADRSGAGSALITAMRQVGATIGVAILGAVLSNVYQARLAAAAMPAPLASVARSSVAAGVTVAHRIGSVSLLASVRSAFVDGLDIMLWTCGGIALASALLALAFLPRRARGGAAGGPEPVPAGSGETSSERAELGI